MSENKLILVHVFDKNKYLQLVESHKKTQSFIPNFKSNIPTEDCYRELLISQDLIIKVEELIGNPFVAQYIASNDPIPKKEEGLPNTVMETSNSGKYFVLENISFFKSLFNNNCEE